MGTGYTWAGRFDYQPGEVILEVGTGDSTNWLAEIGPLVVTIDPANRQHPGPRDDNIEYHRGLAEDVLAAWERPIGFAWLDGHDFPYDGNPADYYTWQEILYEKRGQPYSQQSSRDSHLQIAALIAGHARIIAFDDTWRTHRFSGPDRICFQSVPPATTPAPPLALNQPDYRNACLLDPNHPHHNRPEIGWDGKGGDAVPYLLQHGYHLGHYGLGLVVLERDIPRGSVRPCGSDGSASANSDSPAP